MSLATKYRPNTFDSVIGQESIKKILKQQLLTGQFKNCYLFNGASGCGKTTCARILANEINKGNGSPIEIDAASNNGVDNVRELVRTASERSLDSEYKVFILDEVHVFTNQAWQVFLKCIEEPPTYTVFIFCTTEKNKVPDTIKNRCQVFNFNRISPKDIENRLIYICQQEGFTNYEATCDLISKISNGCMRDAIMKLEQCSNYSKDLSPENAKLILTDLSYEAMFRLTVALQDKHEDQVLEIIEKLYNSGNDLKTFINSYLEFTLDLTKYILFKNMQLTNIPTYLEPAVKQTIQINDSLNWFKAFADLLLNIKTEIKYDTSYKSTIEAYLLRACR